MNVPILKTTNAPRTNSRRCLSSADAPAVGDARAWSCRFATSVQSSILPPAASIEPRAPFVTEIPATIYARFNGPSPKIFAYRTFFEITPAALSDPRLTSAPASFSSAARRTSLRVKDLLEENPNLGSRRCNGIWPPSNPRLTPPPAREFWPLCPRPPVLPRPEAAPRPRRFRVRFEPAPGLMSFRPTLQFLDIQEIGYLADHASRAGCVLDHCAVMHPPQAETTHARPVARQAPISTLLQRDPESLTAFCRTHPINPAAL